MYLRPGIASVRLRLYRVDPRTGGNDWIPADDTIWNIAGANIILAEVVKIRPECAVHHRPKIRWRVVAVIEFLDRNNVRFQTLKNANRKRLITLAITVEVG